MREKLSSLLCTVGVIMFLIFAAGVDASPMRVVIGGMAASAAVFGVGVFIDPRNKF